MKFESAGGAHAKLQTEFTKVATPTGPPAFTNMFVGMGGMVFEGGNGGYLKVSMEVGGF